MKRKSAIVYIAGPYRAPTFEQRALNIFTAWQAARRVWLAGHSAFCPHANTAFMCEDADGKRVNWIGGDCEIIRRCVDHLHLLPGWAESEGAQTERDVALTAGIPVWHNLDDLLAYLKTGTGVDTGRVEPDLPERASSPKMKEFSSGAVRQDKTGKGRFDLISPIGLRRLAVVYEEGGKVHGDRNWEAGIPLEGCLDSACRHINQYREGSRAEDHLAHAVWNLFSRMHLEETGKGL